MREPDGLASNDPAELAWWRDGRPDGTPLLLVNGLGSPAASYEEGFVDALAAEGFAVVRFDNRDLGRSSRHPGLAYTVADQAADAVAVLDAVGWERAVVWGMSMGGMIAQQVAIDHPERVTHLVSVMSNTGELGVAQPSPEAMTALVTPAPSDREAWLAHRAATEQIWASPAWRNSEWQQAKAEAVYDAGVDPAGTGRQYQAVQRSGSRDEALRSLAIPTLVIHGLEDTLLPPAHGRHTAEVIPGARLVELEGMGHDLPPDRWQPLARLTAEFCAV